MTKFKHQNREYDVKIGWRAAMDVFPERFNIKLTKLLVDMGTTNETLQVLMVDDDNTVAMMWYYIHDQSDSIEWEQFLDHLTTQEVTAFREAFWQEVLNFSGPLKMPVLDQAWKQLRKYLKNATLDELGSELLPEEST